MGGFQFDPEGYASQQEPQARLPQPPEQVPQSPQVAEVAQIWKQNQAELKRQQAEADSRKQDLVLAERMAKLMDPNVPKPARKFLYDEMSRASGVDPKGETSKSVGTMLLALDPEALEGLNRNFAAKLKDAKPGEIKQLVQSVLTGQMSGMELLKVAQPAPAAPPAASPGAAAPAPPGGAAAPPAAAQPDLAKLSLLPPSVPSSIDSDVKRRRIPHQGETPAPYTVVEPSFAAALGVDYTKPLRVQDLTKEGYKVPFTHKEQQDKAKEIHDITAGITDVISNASKVHQLFAGKPETLGVVGTTARTIDQAIDQIKGAAQLAGLDTKERQRQVGDDGLKIMTEGVVRKIQAMYKTSGIEQTATESARLQGAILDMAYSMAVARGIPGNRLTNAIIAQHLNTLGHSQSVAQFEATLGDAVDRATKRSADRIAQEVGGPATWTPNLAATSNDTLETMTASPKMVPDSLKKVLADEIQKRIDIASGKTPKNFGRSIERSSPTLEEEQAYEAKQEATRERRTDFAEGREKDRLAMEKERDQRAARGETRAEARAAEQTAHTRFQENMALRREARLEAQQKKDKIGEAFVKLGQMIGHSSAQLHLPAISQGGDQDAGAFRITPAQRRKAPDPVDAAKYQRKK
jgi:hypothetical protein